ncbi:hypothetical protein FB107DRAFT_251983 [Schizophyllum commune]
MPDDFPPLLLDDDDVQNDPDFAWYSDKGSGGYHLPFGTHTGRTVNDVPESYLVWAKTHLKGRYGVHRSVTRTLGAIEAFVEGLEGCLDEWFADFIVPCGVHHRGKTIRRCSDRAWLSWVVGRDRVRRSHPLFVKAVHVWLGSKTRLKASVDPTTFLPPARYHADLRESMPREGDVTDDGVESLRPTPTHADSDASITDPEDEEDQPSQHSHSPAYRPHSPAYRPHSPAYRPHSPAYRPHSPAYRPHSRGSNSNFVVADDRVSVSTDDSAYGELERAESLLRSAQKRASGSAQKRPPGSVQKKKRRRSSEDDHDENPSKRRARGRHRARVVQEPESPGPRTRARALAASQARGEAATSASGGATTSASGVAGASTSGAVGASLSFRNHASWSASASTAHKKPLRTYGRRALTLSERLARLVDPPTPEPDGAGLEEGVGAHGDAREEEEDVHADVREEEEEEEEEEVEEELEAQEQEARVTLPQLAHATFATPRSSQSAVSIVGKARQTNPLQPK